MSSIHGHEVLHYIIDNEPSREQLVAAFPAGSRFHACSADNMDLDGLLAFLSVRGKISEVDGRITTDPSKMCQHED